MSLGSRQINHRLTETVCIEEDTKEWAYHEGIVIFMFNVTGISGLQQFTSQNNNNITYIAKYGEIEIMPFM